METSDNVRVIQEIYAAIQRFHVEETAQVISAWSESSG